MTYRVFPGCPIARIRCALTRPSGRIDHVRRSGLARIGVPIWIDRGIRIAHAKAMVIDDEVALVGSMN